jgi:hypothetical protein
MVATSILNRSARSEERNVESVKIIPPQPACCWDRGDANQFGHNLDATDTDVFEADHTQPSPQALSVDGVELMSGAARNADVAAPDCFLHCGREQVLIRTRERCRDFGIDSEPG